MEEKGEGRRRGLGRWRAEVGSELVGRLGEGVSLARSVGWVRERVRERDGFHGNGKKKEKKKKHRADICTQLLVTTSISSLLATCSDKIRFVADNITKHSYFPFSDNFFSLLFLTFSDKIGFVTNSITSNAFSDKSFCHKKLKLLVTNKFITVDEFSFAPIISFGTLNLAQYIVTKSNFRR